MGFKGVRPPGQPRTLRSIAEDKGSTPASREGELPYDANAGVPQGTPGAGTYTDGAAAARPASGAAKRGASPADKTPFK